MICVKKVVDDIQIELQVARADFSPLDLRMYWYRMASFDFTNSLGRFLDGVQGTPNGSQGHDGRAVALKMTALVAVDVKGF
jgi:hypothetical protein